MKKLLLPLLAFTIGSYAQNHASLAVGFDARNLAFGSAPTNYKSALNYTIDGHIVAKGVDINLGFEAFNEIKYYKRHIGMGFHIPVAYISGTDIKVSVIPSFKGNVIVRKIDGHQQFFTFSGDVTLNFDLSDRWAFQMVADFLPREDLKRLYNDDRIVTSGYLKFVYKLQND